jgi:hypothetical protein
MLAAKAYCGSMSEETSDSIQSQGGRARAESLTPEQRREIASRAASARWGADGNLPKAEYEGELTIGDMSFQCSVLSDGTRILTQSDFMEGMGMYYSGWVAKNRSAEDVSAEVPHFLSFSSLKPFIPKHLGDLQSIIVKYRTVRGTVAHGIKAEIIPKICEIWLDAHENTRLGVRQKKIAGKAKILMRALAHVGIIALVDEATGYQSVRARHALEEILERFIATEFRKWAKTFPDEFYSEIFRLRHWKYDESTVKRTPLIGKLTIDLVYDRLAPGVRQRLEELNPKNEKGNRRHKHFQRLTEDIGDPSLRAHLASVITLMRVADEWGPFMKMLNRALPRFLPMPLFDEPEQKREA